MIIKLKWIGSTSETGARYETEADIDVTTTEEAELAGQLFACLTDNAINGMMSYQAAAWSNTDDS